VPNLNTSFLSAEFVVLVLRLASAAVICS